MMLEDARLPCPAPCCPGVETHDGQMVGCGDGHRTTGCPFEPTPDEMAARRWRAVKRLREIINQEGLASP